MEEPIKAALCLRVSTDGQTVANQERELREVADAKGWSYEPVERQICIALRAATERTGFRDGWLTRVKDALQTCRTALMTRRGSRAATTKALRAATVTLPFLFLLQINVGHAIDVPPPGGTSPLRLTLDLSLDSSSLRARSLDANVTLAPFGGINDSGLRLRLSLNESWYEYLASDSPRSIGKGNGNETDFLIGYGVASERVSLIALVGVASTGSEDEGVSRSARRGKAVVSIYATPTDSR